MVILKKISESKTKTISIRIPFDLYSRIEVIKSKAKEHGFEFDLQKNLIQTVERIVKSAENELNELSK